MEILPFDINNYEIIGYGLLLTLAVLLSVVAVRRKATLSHWLADNALDTDSEETPLPLPGVSVIVLAAHADADYMEESIPLMMEQDYPDFEVIVVNMDKSEAVDDAIIRLQMVHPTLRATFIPGSSANVSKRKLGITLGVKAARHDVVAITSAHCFPQSRLWLRAMGRHFDDYTDMVLGYSHNRHADDRAFGHRYRTYDTTADAARYLAAAIHGCTFRGNADNIAYKRSAFLAVKGFSSSLNLKYGDDDIFVSQVADGDNVAVELSPESILESRYVDYAYFYKVNKERHYFTQKFLPSKMLGIRILTQIAYYAFLLLTAAGIVYPALLAADGADIVKPVALASLALAAYLAEVLINIFAQRRMAKVLQSPLLFFSIPLFRFVRPIINTVRNSKAPQARNYTWE